MTLNQATKRLEKLAIALDGLRGRIENLTKDMSSEAPEKKAPTAKAARNGKRSAIGRSIVYGGVKGKVVERKGNKFVAEMADGKRKQVSTTYVYRQLNGKSEPEAAQPVETAPAAQPAPQTVTHDQLVMAPAESKVA